MLFQHHFNVTGILEHILLVSNWFGFFGDFFLLFYGNSSVQLSMEWRFRFFFCGAFFLFLVGGDSVSICSEATISNRPISTPPTSYSRNQQVGNLPRTPSRIFEVPQRIQSKVETNLEHSKVTRRNYWELATSLSMDTSIPTKALRESPTPSSNNLKYPTNNPEMIEKGFLKYIQNDLEEYLRISEKNLSNKQLIEENHSAMSKNLESILEHLSEARQLSLQKFSHNPQESHKSRQESTIHLDSFRQ